MWRFSNQDVSSGAQVPLSVPQNGRAVGPPLLTERKFTNPGGCVALGLGFLVVAATYAVPYVIGEPDPSGGRLLFGTDYKGDICKDGEFLYPLLRSGVGVCVDECPNDWVDGEDYVTNNDPDDKANMVCMDAADYADYTEADENGYTDFATMTPKVAYKYGVCNYKYRTSSLSNRCYFTDANAALAFDYKVPHDMVFLFAQAFFSSAIAPLFSVMGTALLVNVFVWATQSPRWLTDTCMRLTGGHQAYKVVWLAIWGASAAMMVLGSRMFFDSVKMVQLPVDPHPYTEVLALRAFGFLLWCGGTAWIFTMLRARHAVTLGVMLVVESERCLAHVGKRSQSLISWMNLGICVLGLSLATYGVVNVSTQNAALKVTDEFTGAEAYQWGYTQNPGTMASALLVLFAAFWGCQWLSDTFALGMAISVCRWFFSRKKGPTLLLWKDCITGITVHCGTVAIGSFLHIFTNGPHRILSTLERFATHAASASSSAASKGSSSGEAPVSPLERSVGAALICCLDWVTLPCVENLIKYASPSAYMATAMFGTGYWASAKAAFFLTIRNKNRVGATLSVATVVPIVGQVACTAIAAAMYYFIQVWGFPDEVPIAMSCATMLCSITAWIMARQFLVPMTVAPVALLQCYMLDGEYFAHKPTERFAEKEFHAWVDTYGGEFATYTDMVL